SGKNEKAPESSFMKIPGLFCISVEISIPNRGTVIPADHLNRSQGHNFRVRVANIGTAMMGQDRVL
ncbi:hypothetical protein CHH67_05265, partial [Paenibacillus campinasensis]